LMRKKEDCSATLAIRQHGGFLATDRYRWTQMIAVLCRQWLGWRFMV
jgi:hypothetical protein